MVNLFKKSKKFIFCDVDGVLNNQVYKANNTDANHDLDFKNVLVLSTILKKTGAKLIIVSSRIGDTVKYVKLKRELAEYNIVAEDYCFKAGAYRTDYVNDYIKENNIEHYVVIDDNEFKHKETFGDRFIKIDPSHGLIGDKINRVIKKYIFQDKQETKAKKH